MAMRAARSPNHGNGSRKPNMANDGMVCRILATVMTGFAHRGERVSHTPAGIAIAAAKSMAAPVSHRCSTVSVAISPPYCDQKPPLISALPCLFLRDERPGCRRQSRAVESSGMLPDRGLRSASLAPEARCDAPDRGLHRGHA